MKITHLFISLLSLALLSIPEFSYSQMTQSQIKEYKKENKLKSMELHQEEDGFQYYTITTKDNKQGVISIDGNTIVPPISQYLTINYIKGRESGMGAIAWHPTTQSVFHCTVIKEETTTNNFIGHFMVFSLAGQPLLDLKNAKWENDGKKDGYLYLGDLNNGNPNCIGLYTLDGKEIIEPVYSALVPCDNYCIVYIEVKDELGLISETKRFGATSLDGSFYSIPCRYNRVKFDVPNKKWLVKDIEGSDFRDFIPGEVTIADEMDEGITFFWTGEFDNCINYFSNCFSQKPWATFYSGIAMIEKANHELKLVDKFVDLRGWKQDFNKQIVPTQPLTYREYFYTHQFDFESIKNLYAKGYDMLISSIEEESPFINQAYAYMHLPIDVLYSRVEEKQEILNQYWPQFIEETERYYENQRLLKLQREQELQAKREAIIAEGVNVIFSLFSDLTKSHKSSNNKPAAPSTTSINRSKNSVSQQNSDSSSSESESSDNRKKRPCRACGGKGFMVEERIAGEPKWCDKCGKSRNPHIHETCPSCKGNGWHY